MGLIEEAKQAGDIFPCKQFEKYAIIVNTVRCRLSLYNIITRYRFTSFFYLIILCLCFRFRFQFRFRFPFPFRFRFRFRFSFTLLLYDHRLYRCTTLLVIIVLWFCSSYCGTLWFHLFLNVSNCSLNQSRMIKA